MSLLPVDERKSVLAELTEKQAADLLHDWQFWARPQQLAPPGDWATWLIMTGRGWGKTRTAAEWIRREAESGRRHRLALVGATAADTRDVMVEGESGLKAIAPPWNRPTYEPSKRRLTWPNGALATLYSADEPERLRGPQHDGAWVDELRAWRYLDAWAMLLFGLRLGDAPQAVVTTTPKPAHPVLLELLASTTTVVTTGRSAENRLNLAPTFFDTIVGKYAGSSMGQQELEGILLEEAEGALWKRATMIDAHRVTQAPEPLRRICVAVDPSASSTGAETGIVVAGLGRDGHGYVLADCSVRGSPDTWATAAVGAYTDYQADVLVAEANNGGEMVAATIKTARGAPPVKLVHASRGKQTRAEPIARLYEQGKVHHVGGFPLLEQQMCSWEPGDESPDRLDALVWALTELMLGGVVETAAPRSLPHTNIWQPPTTSEQPERKPAAAPALSTGPRVGPTQGRRY